MPSFRSVALGLAFAGTALVTFGGASTAHASTRKWPVEKTERNLTMPETTIRIDGTSGFPEAMDNGNGPSAVLPGGMLETQFYTQTNDQGFYTNGGVTLAPIDHLQFGLTMRNRWAPNGHEFEPMRLHLTWEFFSNKKIDVGLHGALNIPWGNNYFVTLVGVPVQWHITPKVRMDFGGYFHVAARPANGNVDTSVPLLFNFQVHPKIFLGPETAFVTQGGFNSVVVPLGFFIGGSVVNGAGLLVDITGRVRSANIGDGFDYMQVFANADFYFDI